MRYGYLAVAVAVSFVVAPLAHAEDAVVADEFEQQQTVDGCDAHGTGFAKLPGTNTCVRVGGKVRFDKSFSKRSSSSGGETMLEFETRSD